MTEIYTLSKESTKKLNWWNVIRNLVFTIALLVMTFLPVASIGEISIGNYYELLIQKINKIESVQHIKSIVWFAILCLVVFAINIFVLIDSFVRAIKVKVREVIVKPIYKRFIAWAIYAMIKVFIIYALCVFLAKPYGFRMVTPIIIAILLTVSKLLKFIFSSIAINKFEIDHIAQPPKRIKSKKQEGETGEKSKKAIIGNVIIAINFTIILVLGVGSIIYVTPKLIALCSARYNKTLYESIYDEKLEIGKEYGPYTLTIDEEKGIKINWMNPSATPLTISGEAYHYCNDKLEEMEEEFKSMIPEGDSKKDLEKFGEKMKALAADIEEFSYICETYSFSYEKLNFDFVGDRLEDWGTKGKKRAYEYIYDATPDLKNPVKWGERYSLVERLLYREKIELSEYEFKSGTDFSQEVIVAKVQYGDGSIHISVINPSNIEELNSAKTGEQVIKWSDAWGDYEATIELIP